MSTEIIKIDSASLVGIYETATTRVSKARGLWETKYKAMEYGPDTAAALETFEANLKTAKKEINDQRSPFTRQIAEIPKLFTQAEGELDAWATEIANKRIQYKRQVAAKQAEAEAERQKEANKVRAMAQFKPTVEQILLDMMHDLKTSHINSLIGGLEPTPFVMEQEAWRGVCKTAMGRIGGNDFAGELAESIQADKPLIIEGFNKDVSVLTAMCEKSKGKPDALKNIGRMLGQTYQETSAQIESTKEVAAFEAEVQVAQVVQSEGPVIKKKLVCQPKDHKECLQLFSFWMGKENPELADVLKVISKAVTMANRMGLKGETINGVTFVEDVK
jgi:Skp family chaperone for outer membrane proteins